MRAICFLVIVVLPLAPARSEAQSEAVIIELEAYFSHGELKYFQTLDAGGRLTVELARGGEGYDVASIRDEAMIPPAMFEAVKELLVGLERSRGEGGWQRESSSSATAVLRNFDGEVLERVSLDALPPGQRRMILDLFSILHTFASDVELDLVGVRARRNDSMGRGGDAWSSIRWHLYFIEAGVLVLLAGLAMTVLRSRKRSG